MRYKEKLFRPIFSLFLHHTLLFNCLEHRQSLAVMGMPDDNTCICSMLTMITLSNIINIYFFL